MNPHLDAILLELEAALQRVRRLDQSISADAWSRRPPDGGWSAAECLEHVNQMAEAMLQPLREGVEAARSRGERGSRSYRRDPLGWLIWRASRPGRGVKVKTRSQFLPSGGTDPMELVANFERLHRELAQLVRAANGLPIDRIRMPSPVDPRVRYSVYSGLSIAATHAHRHLAQAERAAR